MTEIDFVRIAIDVVFAVNYFLTCRAFDLGYDVWAGTLRGCDGEMRSVENLEPRRYWDFSVNEHAWEDIPAFLAQIRTAKEKELNPKGVFSDDRLCEVAASVIISHSC